jgi:molybdopterin/thiamine biosynthesis adenylyltransferase
LNTNKIIIITDPEKDRYNTFTHLSWWDQECIKNATVGVLGAGATGNEVLKNLALMGIGKIFIADYDVVQQANLSRSILYRDSDNGNPKALIAARAIKMLNPDVEVFSFRGDVIHELGLGVYRKMDLIVSCVDGVGARFAINRACYKVNKPWVDGAMDGMFGIARVFWPGKGPCYECTMYEEDIQLINERYSCTGLAIQAYAEGKIPTTPMMASLLGAVQTQEVLKILHELRGQKFKSKSISGRVFVYDGLNYSASWNTYGEKKNCLSHFSYNEIIELQDVSTRRSTLTALFKALKRIFKEDFVIELDYKIILEMFCGICEKKETVNIPDFRLTHEHSICCGEIRRIVDTDQLTGKETFCYKLLTELGFPLLPIIRIKTSSKVYYVELTGDIEYLVYS